MTAEPAICKLCGEPMPPGEEMFYYHGYSGPCPKPPLPKADAPLPAPTQEELDTARDFVSAKYAAVAIATARRDGFRAGIESAAKAVGSMIGNPEPGAWPNIHDGTSWNAAVLRCEATVRALSPDAADHAADHGDGR